MKGKTISMYGCYVTFFENGDVYIKATGDVVILNARSIITDVVTVNIAEEIQEGTHPLPKGMEGEKEKC